MMMAHFVGGKLDGQIMPVSEVEAAWCNGKHTDDLSAERKRGAWVHRAELDNQPMVDGYLSPMWDGGMLRYETPEVYDMLSR